MAFIFCSELEVMKYLLLKPAEVSLKAQTSSFGDWEESCIHYLQLGSFQERVSS